MRTFSLSILAMKSVNSFISRSVFIISFIASRMTTESSICLCARKICSARFWNCFGLTSSAPILRGFSILRLDTSRNLLANNCESSIYLCNTSRLESSLNNSGIFDISTSWLNFIMKPFSSKEISLTSTLSRTAIPAKR